MCALYSNSFYASLEPLFLTYSKKFARLAPQFQERPYWRCLAFSAASLAFRMRLRSTLSTLGTNWKRYRRPFRVGFFVGSNLPESPPPQRGLP